VKKKIFIAAFILFLCSRVSAQSMAQIQLAVAAPDPAKAGEDITFQVLILNMDSSLWKKDDITCIAEIFSRDGKYLQKTESVKPAQDIASGSSALFLVPMRIPPSYSGRYQFRIMLYKKGENILTDVFRDFNVKAAVIKKKEKRVYLSGNIAYSFKDSQRLDWQSSLSANLLGRIYKKTLMFNSNVYSSQSDSFNLDTIYASVFSEKYKLSLGDVMPDFSPLSIYSLTGRGISAGYGKGKFSFSGCFLRTQLPSEGDSSSNGVYARYTGGVNARMKLPANFKLNISNVYTYDDKNSIEDPGPSLDLYKNSVISTLVEWEARRIKFSAECASSNKSIEDVSGVSKSSSAVAWTTGAKFAGKVFDAKIEYKKIDPDFLNLSSPGVYPDRIGYEGSLNLYPISIVRVNYSQQYSHDNLDEDSAVVTTNQKIYQYGCSIVPGKVPSLTFSAGVNSVWGDDRTVLENETKSGSYGISYYIGGQMLSAAISQSKFRNSASTSSVHDLDTNGVTFSYSGKFSKKVSFDFGYTSNKTTDIMDNTDDENISLSASSNIILSKKISVFIYGSTTKREKPSENILTKTMNVSSEFTYNLEKSLMITLGFTFDKSDETDDSNDYSSSGYIFRLHYSF